MSKIIVYEDYDENKVLREHSQMETQGAYNSFRVRVQAMPVTKPVSADGYKNLGGYPYPYRRESNREIARLVAIVFAVIIGIIVIGSALSEFSEKRKVVKQQNASMEIFCDYMEEKYGIVADESTYEFSEISAVNKYDNLRAVCGYTVRDTKRDEVIGLILYQLEGKNKIKKQVCFDNLQTEDIEQEALRTFRQKYGIENMCGSLYMSASEKWLTSFLRYGKMYNTRFDGDIDTFFLLEKETRSEVFSCYLDYSRTVIGGLGDLGVNGTIYIVLPDYRYQSMDDVKNLAAEDRQTLRDEAFGKSIDEYFKEMQLSYRIAYCPIDIYEALESQKIDFLDVKMGDGYNVPVNKNYVTAGYWQSNLMDSMQINILTDEIDYSHYHELSYEVDLLNDGESEDEKAN